MKYNLALLTYKPRRSKKSDPHTGRWEPAGQIEESTEVRALIKAAQIHPGRRVRVTPTT